MGIMVSLMYLSQMIAMLIGGIVTDTLGREIFVFADIAFRTRRHSLFRFHIRQAHRQRAYKNSRAKKRGYKQMAHRRLAGCDTVPGLKLCKELVFCAACGLQVRRDGRYAERGHRIVYILLYGFRAFLRVVHTKAGRKKAACAGVFAARRRQRRHHPLAVGGGACGKPDNSRIRQRFCVFAAHEPFA